MFDWVHSVDSAKLAQALARHAKQLDRILPVLVQLNVTGEARKHGVSTLELDRLLEGVAGLQGLELQGLMSIGPVEGGTEEARASFRALASCVTVRGGRWGLCFRSCPWE